MPAHQRAVGKRLSTKPARASVKIRGLVVKALKSSPDFSVDRWRCRRRWEPGASSTGGDTVHGTGGSARRAPAEHTCVRPPSPVQRCGSGRRARLAAAIVTSRNQRPIPQRRPTQGCCRRAAWWRSRQLCPRSGRERCTEEDFLSDRPPPPGDCAGSPLAAQAGEHGPAQRTHTVLISDLTTASAERALLIRDRDSLRSRRTPPWAELIRSRWRHPT